MVKKEGLNIFSWSIGSLVLCCKTEAFIRQCFRAACVVAHAFNSGAGEAKAGGSP